LRARFINELLFIVWGLTGSIYKRVGISFILVFAGLRARFINELLFSFLWSFGVCRSESSVYKRVIICFGVLIFAGVRARFMNG